MFKKLIAEAMVLVEGAGMPGKLTQKYDRGSRGADSFRSYTKKATNRARRRAEKTMLADTPPRQTKGYSHATWPSNPVYTQKLYDKPKAESKLAEGGGSRATKKDRQFKAMSGVDAELRNRSGRGLGDVSRVMDRTPKQASRLLSKSMHVDPLFAKPSNGNGYRTGSNTRRLKKTAIESVLDQFAEGGGSRASKSMRQALHMKGQGIEPTPARGYHDPDKKAMSRDLMNAKPYKGDPLAQRANRHPDDPHTQLVDKMWRRKNPGPLGPKHPSDIWREKQGVAEDEQIPEPPETFTVHHRDGRKVGGPYASLNRARRAVDKHDNKYGGYAHGIKSSKGRTVF